MCSPCNCVYNVSYLNLTSFQQMLNSTIETWFYHLVISSCRQWQMVGDHSLEGSRSSMLKSMQDSHSGAGTLQMSFQNCYLVSLEIPVSLLGLSCHFSLWFKIAFLFRKMLHSHVAFLTLAPCSLIGKMSTCVRWMGVDAVGNGLNLPSSLPSQGVDGITCLLMCSSCYGN